MTRLQGQLQRLFRVMPGGESVALRDAGGQVQTLVITVNHLRDWSAIAGLLGGLQERLGLPLPAVAVDGLAGFQLWLPLVEPVVPALAASFLSALREQFLAAIDDSDLALLPLVDGAATVRCIPALSAESARWSAFIDPNMGSMFADEGGLDFEPNPDRQADLLAAIAPVAPADFARALAILRADAVVAPVSAEAGTGCAGIGGGYAEPRDFLRAVMNEASAPLALRIEAAKALLGDGTQ